MFILDSMLIGSLRFVLDKILAAAEAEANDDTSLREQLLEGQMRLELGEISEKQFRKTEREILARIRQIKRSRSGALTMTSPDVKITGIEATVADELRRE
jgi:Gas vesicle protein G